MRSISFTGTLKEWKVDGRKDEEALEHPNRVRQMVERQQKEQFLRDFERHVEQQDMQRGHQRLAGELGMRYSVFDNWGLCANIRFMRSS